MVEQTELRRGFVALAAYEARPEESNGEENTEDDTHGSAAKNVEQHEEVHVRG